MVSKRVNLKVNSLAGLEGGGVSIEGDLDIDGVVTTGRVVLDREGWEKVCRNADWFRTRSSARVDTLDRRIESLVDRVVRDERELGVLSTGEQIAVAVVLDRRELAPPPYNGSWQDALDRLGEDWLAACRRVASRRETNDDASFDFIRSIGARR